MDNQRQGMMRWSRNRKRRGGPERERGADIETSVGSVLNCSLFINVFIEIVFTAILNCNDFIRARVLTLRRPNISRLVLRRDGRLHGLRRLNEDLRLE